MNKRVLKKIIFMSFICLAVSLLFCNSFVLAKEYSDYTSKDIKEACKNDKSIINKLSEEENEEYIEQQELILEKELDMEHAELERAKGDTIYTSQPKKKDTKNSGDSLDDMMEDADSFIEQGEVTYQGGLSGVSNIISNILLSVGVVIAVIVGGIIGIKLMASGIEQKAEAKKLLVPYIAGCIVIFGGFGIWKLLVTILQGI